MRCYRPFAALLLGAISALPADAADYLAAFRPRRWCPDTPCCPEDSQPQAPTKPSDADMGRTPTPRPDDTGAVAEDAQLFGSLAGTAEAGLGAGVNTAFLGRADSLNRFNLFDNMGAEPATRAWFAYQFLEGMNTQVVGNSNIARPNLSLYRIGAEYAVSDVFSFAAQGMYNVSTDTAVGTDGDIFDEWSNPQFIAKRVLWRNCCTTVSGTLGFVPQVGVDTSTINESFARLQPGLLAYRDFGNDRFGQAGMQFNIPLEGNATATIDWALSAGKWFYRHESLDGCGDGCCRPWIVGITGQVELLGKHVAQDATITDGFLVASQPSSPGGPVVIQTFAFEEERNVVDFTIGSQILFRNNTGLAAAFSTPISNGETRRTEMILTYNVYF